MQVDPRVPSAMGIRYMSTSTRTSTQSKYSRYSGARSVSRHSVNRMEAAADDDGDSEDSDMLNGIILNSQAVDIVDDYEPSKATNPSTRDRSSVSHRSPTELVSLIFPTVPRWSIWSPLAFQDFVYQRMKPIFYCLKAIGLMPANLRGFQTPVRSKLASVASVILLMCGLSLFAYNIYQLIVKVRYKGFLNVDTITSIVASLKPLQAMLGMLLFNIHFRDHKHLLVALNHVQLSFCRDFALRYHWALEISLFYVAVLLAFCIPFGVRISEYVIRPEKPLNNVFSDMSLIFVPILTVWQLIPLFYFAFCNRLIQFWLRSLNNLLKTDRYLQRFPLERYYDHFLRITNCSRALGDFLNSMICLHILLAIFILCLTIYFLTFGNEIFYIPANSTHSDTISIFFLPVWAGMQILSAIAYVFGVIIVGMKTNELARDVLSPLLSSKGCGESRQQIVNIALRISFVQRIQTQSCWGVTLWRICLVERRLLITIFSAILTYAVILVRLKKSFNDPYSKTGEL